MQPSPSKNARAWFKNAKLGLFIHWGLYSIPGNGEHFMARDENSPERYARLADCFNPRAFTPRTWCLAAKKAGMKYVVFTTRHHDGFALFDSQVSDFTSVKTSSGRDFVAEFVAACREFNLGVGLYYSLSDWRFGRAGVSETKEGMLKSRAQVHAQLRELMTHYGKIDILWYDGGAIWPELAAKGGPKDTSEFYQSEKLNVMVRELQPGILINNRAGLAEDFGTPEGQSIIRAPKDTELWEACMTMGDDDFSYWGYKHRQIVRRTPAQVVLLMLHVIEHGGNLLLNVGPDAEGQIPAWQMENLEALGGWMEDHAEAIYGTEATGIARPNIRSHQGNSCAFLTRKENVYYLYLYEWPGREFRIPFLQERFGRITIVKTGSDLSFETAPDGALHVMGLPATPLDSFCTVLKLELLS